MYAFDYHKPAGVDAASQALSNAEDPKVMAGGMTLIPTLKQRLAMPSDLIDLAGCDLAGISVEGDTLVVGAMTTHAAVASSDGVKGFMPGLAALAEGIGDAQVRNRGTMGGSIANHDPAADYPGAVLACNATIVTTKREIAADDFFTGLFETALDEDEIITQIRFPKADAMAYAKFPNPASRYAVVGVCVAKTGGAVRVAVTGASQEGVFRSADLESALGQSFTPETAAGVAHATDTLNRDIHASAEYRAHLISVMAKRAVAAC